jgi:hypothetical protein
MTQERDRLLASRKSIINKVISLKSTAEASKYLLDIGDPLVLLSSLAEISDVDSRELMYREQQALAPLRDEEDTKLQQAKIEEINQFDEIKKQRGKPTVEGVIKNGIKDVLNQGVVKTALEEFVKEIKKNAKAKTRIDKAITKFSKVVKDAISLTISTARGVEIRKCDLIIKEEKENGRDNSLASLEAKEKRDKLSSNMMQTSVISGIADMDETTRECLGVLRLTDEEIAEKGLKEDAIRANRLRVVNKDTALPYEIERAKHLEIFLDCAINTATVVGTYTKLSEEERAALFKRKDDQLQRYGTTPGIIDGIKAPARLDTARLEVADKRIATAKKSRLARFSSKLGSALGAISSAIKGTSFGIGTGF